MRTMKIILKCNINEFKTYFFFWNGWKESLNNFNKVDLFVSHFCLDILPLFGPSRILRASITKQKSLLNISVLKTILNWKAKRGIREWYIRLKQFHLHVCETVTNEMIHISRFFYLGYVQTFYGSKKTFLDLLNGDSKLHSQQETLLNKAIKKDAWWQQTELNWNLWDSFKLKY